MYKSNYKSALVQIISMQFPPSDCSLLYGSPSQCHSKRFLEIGAMIHDGLVLSVQINIKRRPVRASIHVEVT